jgi:hypothetical protein
MINSMVGTESLLAVDVGTINTRAFLFDITEGTYRFLAMGVSPTTTGGAYNDVGEGVRLALERLQEIAGRTLIGGDGRLIIPSQANGAGVDQVSATLSVGPAIQTVLLGLLADVSLESAQRLVSTTYSRVTESIGLNDRRRTEVQLDAVIRTQPDLIILAGGTEGGASRSLNKLLDLVGLVCHLIPAEKRPQVVYAGNQAMAQRVKARLDSLTPVHLASNIRPSISVEDLIPAQEVLNQTICQIMVNKMPGLQELSGLVAGRLMLTSHAFGRMIRFLSQVYAPGKGVLGVDIGSRSTTVAVGVAGKLALTVSHSMGVGEGGVTRWQNVTVGEVINWLPLHVTEDYVADYLANKLLYPASVPASLEDLAIEQAVARLVLRQALRQMAQRSSSFGYSAAVGLTTQYEPILASGSILTQAPTYGQVLLMLLDALQPAGITTFVLDQNNMLPALGAAASVNTILPVQVLESGAFLNLGTVISPISNARYGSPILRVRLVNPDGAESRAEIKQGTLTVLPVPQGQKAHIHLEPLHRTDVGMNHPGQGGSLSIVGGVFGAVIDARGRPLVLPKDAPRRREMIKKWLWRLGG